MAANPAAAAAENENWEADASEPQRPHRILSQEEIDSLLGFSLSGDENAGRTGVRAIINSTLVPDEGASMLHTVFDRLARLMTTSLTNFTSANVEVSLDGIGSIRFGDYLDAVPAPAVSAAFRSGQLDDVGLITVDPTLICCVVDALMGGRRGNAPAQVEAGAMLERTLATRLIELVLADARQAFAPLSDMAFELDHVGTDAPSAASARPSSAAMAAKFRIAMDGRAGRLELLLSNAALEPLRRNLLQQSAGEKHGCDAIWEGRLASELWAASLEVRAVLAECKQPLGKMLALKVGDTLMLDAAPGAPVKLKCAAVDLAAGHVGRIGHSLAVRMERAITPAAQHAVMNLERGSSGR